MAERKSKPRPRRRAAASGPVRLLRAVEELAAVTTVDEFPAVVLRAVGHLMSWSWLSYNEVDPLAQRAVFLMEPPGPIPPGLWDRWSALSHEHPLIAYYQRTRDPAALAISDLVSAARYHASRIYREVYRFLRVEDQLSVQLRTPAPHVIGIVISRRRRGFTREEHRLLDGLRPYLEVAYRNAQRYSHLHLAVETLGGALEDEGRGVGTLGEDGRWRRLTPTARRLVRKYLHDPGAAGRGDGAEGGAAPPAVLQWVGRQRSAGVLDGAGPLVVDSDGYRLAVRSVPSPDGPQVLLFEEQRVVVPGDPLVALGLSAREGEILRLVSDGHPNAEIARRLDLRVATVKKHIEHVLGKLQVRNRTEAARVALRALGSGGPAAR